MLKMFCDGCGNETAADHLTQPKAGRYEFRALKGAAAWVEFRVAVEVHLSVIQGPANNNGMPIRQLCENCAWRAIQSLDKRTIAIHVTDDAATP